jgi:hypothetical protein
MSNAPGSQRPAPGTGLANGVRLGLSCHRAESCRTARTDVQPDLGYLFYCLMTGAWRGSVEAPGLSLSHRLPMLVVWLSSDLRCPGVAAERVAGAGFGCLSDICFLARSPPPGRAAQSARAGHQLVPAQQRPTHKEQESDRRGCANREPRTGMRQLSRAGVR